MTAWSLSRTVLEALVAVNARTMGGRRSRYWCGPGIFRETKKAPVRGFIGHWSAPAFSGAPAILSPVFLILRQNETAVTDK